MKKREKINPPHGLFSFLLPLAPFSHSSVYLVRAENVGCNNFATAGNDRAFRPLNMQWKLLLRDRCGVVRTWRELMKLRKKRRCSGDFARNVLETLPVSHRLPSSCSHQTIVCLIARRPSHIAIEITQHKCWIEYSSKFITFDKDRNIE